MPHPKDVYDRPDEHRTFVTTSSDKDFEGQYFDRKECPQDIFGNRSGWNQFRDQVIECISAFANANREGGLLVLGVRSNGALVGIDHTTEEQRNALTSFQDKLRYPSVLNKTVEWKTNEGNTVHVLFLYVEYPQGICETLDKRSKAWYRRETQNIPVDDNLRDQIKREKGLVDWEKQSCCPFDLSEVDLWVLQEFRRGYLAETSYEYSDTELLYNAGAIVKNAQDQYHFTNAGFYLNKAFLAKWSIQQPCAIHNGKT